MASFLPPKPVTATGTYNPQQTFNYASGKNSPFGTQVAQVNVPKPAQDLGQNFKGLGATNDSLSSLIQSELHGQVSPDVMNMVKDTGAEWGVSNGMPGSNIQANNSARNLGVTSMDLQKQGVADYNSTIPTVSKTQTVAPELQADINLQNATNAAAPNPGAAASYAQSLFSQYLNRLNPQAAKVPDYSGAFWDAAGKQF